MRDATFSSKAYGTRESKEFAMDGRGMFDLMQSIQRDHKLSSYSLNSVSAHFLGEQKEDVHHSVRRPFLPLAPSIPATSRTESKCEPWPWPAHFLRIRTPLSWQLALLALPARRG